MSDNKNEKDDLKTFVTGMANVSGGGFEGVTQKYDRSLYEDKSAMRQFKKKAYTDKSGNEVKTTIDKYSGKFRL